MIPDLTRLGSHSPNEDEAIDPQEDDRQDAEVGTEEAEAKKKNENAKLVKKVFHVKAVKISMLFHVIFGTIC